MTDQSPNTRFHAEDFMDGANAAPLDYYILPSLDVRPGRLRVAHENFLGIDSYRFETLDFFFGMAEQITLEGAA